MIYQVISPFVLDVNSNSLKEAIKQAIKIKHNMNINQMIIKDQSKHYQANIDYYLHDGRNKVGINMFPTGYNYPIPIVTNDTYLPPRIIQTPLNPMINPFIPTVINIPL